MKSGLTFEQIKRQSSALDFSLPYRVALVDGKIQENQTASNEVLEWLEEVCQLYVDTDEKVRSQIRSMFDNDDKLWYLFMFIDNLKRRIRTQDDVGLLDKALVALSIEDSRFDRRDFSLNLSTLLRVGRNAGIDTNSVFQRAAERSTPSTKQCFLRIAGQ